MSKTFWRLSLLAMVVLWASCSPRSEYANAIPKDAAWVASVDFKSMVQKSGISGKEGEKVVAKLTDALKSGLEGGAYQTAEKIMKNPSESGLSLTDKVYLFATPRLGSIAMLAKVDDEGKVRDLLESLKEEQICTELKSESGCTWTQVGNALCAFDEDAFLLMASNKGDVQDWKGTLLALMRQETKDSYAGTSDFTRLDGADGDISMIVSLALITDEWAVQMRMGMPADIKLEDIKYLLSTSFEKGKVVIDTESLIENKELVALYEKQAEATGTIQGTYMECFPANTVFWTGVNMDGKRVYELLRENPSMKQSLDNPTLPVDLERFFSSIKGDIAVGFSDGFLAYADVTNKEFLQSFEELRSLLAMTGGIMKLDAKGNDQYEFRMLGQSIWFGVKDNMFYLTNKEKMAEEAGRRYGVSLQNVPWAGEVTKNRSFMIVNMEELMKQLKTNPFLAKILGDKASMLNAILEPCEYVDAKAPDWKRGQMNIVMKDKDVNILQLIVRGIGNL